MNNETYKKPELLAPAGSPEKLRIAVLYGADAVYLSGRKYGLRASADNFTDSDLVEAVRFAHSHKVKVYVTLNASLHNEDFTELSEFCCFLEKIQVDAVIASDPGVIRLAKKSCTLPIHVSTQTSCNNSEAALFWKELGASRIITGREISVEQGYQISEKSGLEVEMFIHGAMCMSWSGQCAASTFTASRDPNRGGCVQSCRFPYLIKADTNTNEEYESHFLSSKDLNGISLVPEFCKYQISSLKIEGRMKSVLYLATIVKTYREAIDSAVSGDWNKQKLEDWKTELNTMPHRDYTEASFSRPADSSSVYLKNTPPADNATHKMLGIVLDTDIDSQSISVLLYDKLTKGDSVDFLPFAGNVFSTQISEVKSPSGESLDFSGQASIAILPYVKGIETFNILRRLNAVQ